MTLFLRKRRVLLFHVIGSMHILNLLDLLGGGKGQSRRSRRACFLGIEIPLLVLRGGNKRVSHLVTGLFPSGGRSRFVLMSVRRSRMLLPGNWEEKKTTRQESNSVF